MILFDEKTGKFRDAKTGRLRSDVSGLLSSSARRQYKKFAGNIDVSEYRRKLGQKFYKKSDKPLVKKVKQKAVEKVRKRKGVFEETNITDFDSYINDWLKDFDFVLEEEDTDLETP